MEEIWKDIENYPGYQVSNLGRIKSFKQDKNGIITNGNVSFKGYLRKQLWNENGSKSFAVHRLVAQAFIPNPDNLPQVNHKDENKQNNCVDNSEWCDNDYNIHYGTAIARKAASLTNHPSSSKPIYSIDKDGNKGYFVSVNEVERQLGLSHSNIVRTLKGRTHTCGGRQWFYVED